MAFETYSPNMNLPLPGVGQTSGPQWATDVNASLTLIDQHDHSPGKGVPITPAGLNINANLSIGGNALTNLGYLQFTTGSLLSSLQAIYVSGVDLYYTDGSGNQVRITQSGGIAGSPGSIANLTPPASASYVSANQTFVWQSNTNTPANLDAASIILRNLTANSHGLTLSPPASMTSDFTITFPTLPGQGAFMIMDNAGNIGFPINFTQGITGGSGGNIAQDTITGFNLVASLPGTTAFMAMDSSGNITTPININAGITSGNIAPGGVTGSNIAANTIKGYNLVSSNPGATAFMTMDSSGNVIANIGVGDGITGSNIASNTISNTNIVPGTITGGGGGNLQTDIDLPGKLVTEASKALVVSIANPVNSLAIIRGVVDAFGTPISGEGFSVAGVGTGTYNINFPGAFLSTNTPAVTAIVNAEASGTNLYTCAVNSVTPNGFQITTWDIEALANLPFSFIVCGIRP